MITSLISFIAITYNLKLTHSIFSLCLYFTPTYVQFSRCCLFLFLNPLFSSFLAKRGVREDIATFEARSISSEIRQSVEELLNTNKASFDPKVS